MDQRSWVLMLVNVPFSLTPSPLTATIMATEMPAAVVLVGQKKAVAIPFAMRRADGVGPSSPTGCASRGA